MHPVCRVLSQLENSASAVDNSDSDSLEVQFEQAFIRSDFLGKVLPANCTHSPWVSYAKLTCRYIPCTCCQALYLELLRGIIAVCALFFRVYSPLRPPPSLQRHETWLQIRTPALGRMRVRPASDDANSTAL